MMKMNSMGQQKKIFPSNIDPNADKWLFIFEEKNFTI